MIDMKEKLTFSKIEILFMIVMVALVIISGITVFSITTRNQNIKNLKEDAESLISAAKNAHASFVMSGKTSHIYLNSDGPYYVPREYISPENAISLIKRAGGIPVLAHPLVYHIPEAQLDALIQRLKDAGLMGLEVFYSANTGFDEGIVRRYANKYDLVMTGGSDFHGANKPQISMGTGRGNLKIPYSVLEKLKSL